MMPSSSSDTAATLQRLKQEIQELLHMQIAALERATYIGMSFEQEKDYDTRQEQITGLMDRIMQLQQSHHSKPVNKRNC